MKNLGFGGDDHAIREAVKTVAFHSLDKYTAEEVVGAGLAVKALLDDFRKTHADQVPTYTSSGGLLDLQPRTFAVNDFELALHLDANGHPAMATLQSNGPPPLMAYLATATLGQDSLSTGALESALQYAIRSLTFGLAAKDHWNTQLQSELTRQTELASHGRKFKGRKPEAEGPLTKVIRKYLKRHGGQNPAQVWTALFSAQPEGMTFCESRKLGRYIEFDQRTKAGKIKNSDYKNFANIVYRLRKKLK